MFKRLRTLLLLLCFVVAAGVYAQGAPERINDALADLSTRLGITITLNDLQNWSWGQDNYPDTSLGCPQAGQVYAQVLTVAYQFDLTYGGNIYDYRVAADGSLVLLCSITALAEVTEVPLGVGGDPSLSNPICPAPPVGIIYPPTRFIFGIQGRVTPGLPNNVRTEPNVNGALAGEIPGGATFNILAGPQCDEFGNLWWQVDFDGLVGWTAEFTNGQYLLEPATAALLPTGLEAISVDNADQISEVSRLQGNFAPALAWSKSAEADAPPLLIALGARGSGGAWIYDTNAISESARIVQPGTDLTTIAVGPESTLPLFGSENGGIRLWDISANTTLVERAFLQSQADPVSAVAFSSDGTTLAATGGRAVLQQDVPENQFAISLWDVATVSQKPVALRGHTAEVISLIFNSDNTMLYSGSQDATVRFWNVADGSSTSTQLPAAVNAMALTSDGTTLIIGLVNGSIQTVDIAASIASPFAQNGTPITSVSISPDGTLLAFGDGGGIVHVWDIAERTELMVLQGHTGLVENLSFSPDGTLIASLGEDNTIRLWAVVGGSVG